MRLRCTFAVLALSVCAVCGAGGSTDIAALSAGVSAQPDSVAVEPYRIADNCAGPFRLGAAIPERVEGFVTTEWREDRIDPEGRRCEMPVYIYEIGNEGWVKITPQYDRTAGRANDRIGEIYVYSDLFLTDRGIGAMSSIGEFAAAYPDFRIRYERGGRVFVAETPRLRNVQFIIDDEYYRGREAVLTSGESCELQISDFREATCFTAIRLMR